MRKKLHKQVNPNNKVYDKFYVINYSYEKPENNTRRPTKLVKLSAFKKTLRHSCLYFNDSKPKKLKILLDSVATVKMKIGRIGTMKP